MKDNQLKFLAFLAAAIGAALVGFGVVYGIKTNAIQVHTLSREARKAYNSADYATALSSLQYLADTLSYQKDAARLDLAHAGFLTSRYDTSNRARDLAKDGYPLDTAALADMKAALEANGAIGNYGKLSETARSGYFASNAYNQLGVIAYIMRNSETESEAMAEAAADFKAALQKDPSNEFARYNYELIRTRIDYPEMIMSQVRELIHQRNYKAARALLRKAFDRDNLIQRNYADYAERLENVIRIDSLSRS